MKKFSINNHIYVRLTEKGYEVLMNHENERVKTWNDSQVEESKKYPLETIESLKKKEVEAGYIFQFWEFMNIFGAITGPTYPIHFNGFVSFDDNQLINTD